MGFTPKRLRQQIRAAMKRVEARGDRPPWKHPDLITLTLSISEELSGRETRWVRNHLAMCKVCRERKERMARALKEPVPPRQINETLRRLEEIEREGSND